jgi:hypothetical protein
MKYLKENTTHEWVETAEEKKEEELKEEENKDE